MTAHKILAACILVLLVGCDSDSEKISGHLQQAKQFISNHQPRSAVIELKNALQLDTRNTDARYLLGKLYLTSGASAEAVKELSMARRLGRDDEETTLALGKAYALAGEFKALRALLASLPTTYVGTEWYLLWAEALLGHQPDEAKPDTESLNSAERWLHRALAQSPDDPRPIRTMARVSLLRNQPEVALERLVNAAGGASETDLETWLFKGKLEFTAGEHEQARQSFTRALSLGSGANTPAQLGLVQALLALGEAQAAGPYLLALSQALPDAAHIRYLQALQHRQLGEHAQARGTVREALARDPNHAPSQLLAGQLQFLAGELSQAEELLRSYLTNTPASVAARQLLASVLLEQGRAREALRLLEPLESGTPSDPRLLALMGSAHMQLNRADTAKDYLDRAAALASDQNLSEAAPILTQQALNSLESGDADAAIETLRAAVDQYPEFARAEIILLIAHLHQQDFEQAALLAKSLMRKYPHQPTGHNLLGVVREAAGELPSARERYETAAALQPDYLPARINLARIAWREKKADEAQRWLGQVLEIDPHNPAALVALAELQARQGETQDSIRTLTLASEKNPNAVRPRLILANINLMQGDNTKALKLANEAHDIAADDLNASTILARALYANDEPERAIQQMQTALSQRPDSPQMLYQLAQMQAGTNRMPEASESLGKAIRLAPELHQAKLLLARVALVRGDLAHAAALANELQTALPESAAGALLHGEVLFAKNEPMGALQSFIAAHQQAPSTETLLRLADTYLRLGQAERATAVVSKWCETNSADHRARRWLAAIYLRDGKLDKAAEQYERILEAVPEDVVTLNNLAWIYDRRGEPRALSLAERAFAVTPERAEVADTLGWMLIRADQFERGLALLKQAVSKAPHDNDIRYHLAAARAKAGDRTGAVNELELILAREGAFTERAQAQSLLQSLR